MYIVHQIVNALINPAFVILTFGVLGCLLVRFGRLRLGRFVGAFAAVILFFMAWPPVSDFAGIWLERDYPALSAEEYPNVDAIVVLGGGVWAMPDRLKYPYPLLTDAADRVWHGARLWHALKARNSESSVMIYCTGPEASRNTPAFLNALGVPTNAIVSVDYVMNTEEEAKALGKCIGCLDQAESASHSTFGLEPEAARPKVLLVTSAFHMKRAMRIFERYAPRLEVIPAATDHHFVSDSVRFRKWQYWVPNLEAIVKFSAIEHELVGLLRYMW